jgi:hypothetical protein
MTIKPAVIALVVAMAGIMFPAISKKKRIKKEKIRRVQTKPAKLCKAKRVKF